MGILKHLIISHKRETNGNYVLLMRNVSATNSSSLIFEAGTIVNVEPEESAQLRHNGGFVKILDGYSCLGMLQYAYEGLKEIQFLVIVTGCVSVGKISNSEIFCITDVAMLSMRNGPNDQELASGVKRLLCSGCFYFSHASMANQKSYDLTLSAQRAHMTDETDHRFFWNRLLHRHFERFGINTESWLVKVLCGGINISTVYIGGLQAKACLISRLSCERAGTRFNVRGVNDLGHVANFVETEQVIFINQIVLSYLIVRGSIPLFWEQPGIQVSHRIQMSRGSEISQPGYDKHMFLLRERYENVVIVNLLSSRDSELMINQLFNAHHKASKIGSEFHMVNFDYHALCPRGYEKNLERLHKYELKKYFHEFGFFHAEKGQVIQMQHGVIRTNCLDCLDRTNSMQKFLGSKMLSEIVKSIDHVDTDKVLMRLLDVYQQLWALNGNKVSRIYAGTGAIDGKNALMDGARSVGRTLQNNLLDGSKQEAIDILIIGRTLSRDYSYRAASLLPHYFMYASPSILVKMCDRYLDYSVPERLKIVVGTWNVNGGRHFDNIMHNRARPLSDWLVDYWSSVNSETSDLSNKPSHSPVDIYAIGFQEIVDLNASNIVASSTQNQRDWLLELQQTISRNHKYLLISSAQLVGVCLFIFIRVDLAPYITDICNDQVKTGLRGATGNKGAVATRLRYKATSMCFICAHLAAGQNRIQERNDDYAEITRRIQFPVGRSINSHDYVFWCGDLNYRLQDISNQEARVAAYEGNYSRLLAHDQLKFCQVSRLGFKGYIEGDIKFAPTYKYDTNSFENDSSEKCRTPAYTDRILFKKLHATHNGEDLDDLSQVNFYNRVELLSSDHRPVVAEFEIEVIDVDKEARNKVLDFVLDRSGPPDSTVFVRVDGHTDIGDKLVFATILKLLADEAGEIILVRCINQCLMVIFTDGRAALLALNLNGTILDESMPDSRLNIELRTKNWQQVIRSELLKNKDNTVNLVTGSPPNIHLEDDEDEAAQELNMSLGPEVNPDTLCMESFAPCGTHVDLLEDGLTAPIQTPPVTLPQAEIATELPLKQCPAPPPRPPKSPRHMPTRAPPPPPGFEPDSTSQTGPSAEGRIWQTRDETLSPRNALHTHLSSDIEDPQFDSDEIVGLSPPKMPAPVFSPDPLETNQITGPINPPIKPRLTRPTRNAPPPPVPSRLHDSST